MLKSQSSNTGYIMGIFLGHDVKIQSFFSVFNFTIIILFGCHTKVTKLEKAIE